MEFKFRAGDVVFFYGPDSEEFSPCSKCMPHKIFEGKITRCIGEIVDHTPDEILPTTSTTIAYEIQAARKKVTVTIREDDLARNYSDLVHKVLVRLNDPLQ